MPGTPAGKFQALSLCAEAEPAFRVVSASARVPCLPSQDSFYERLSARRWFSGLRNVFSALQPCRRVACPSPWRKASVQLKKRRCRVALFSRLQRPSGPLFDIVSAPDWVAVTVRLPLQATVMNSEYGTFGSNGNPFFGAMKCYAAARCLSRVYHRGFRP